MNAPKLRLLAASLAALCLAALASPAAAAQWQDNAIGYRWGATFREPGVVDSDGKAKDVAKSILSFTHVDGWKLGGNFLNIDYLISNDADPSVGGAQGAAELYAVYRTDLSLNKVTGTETFKFGPVRDLSLEAGVDLNTKNTAFASRKIMPVLGAVVAFEVPGFLNVGLLGAKEFNQNGIVHKQVTFDPTLIVSTSWGIPDRPGQLRRLRQPDPAQGEGRLRRPDQDRAAPPPQAAPGRRPVLGLEEGRRGGRRLRVLAQQVRQRPRQGEGVAGQHAVPSSWRCTCSSVSGPLPGGTPSRRGPAGRHDGPRGGSGGAGAGRDRWKRRRRRV